ncbi:uncharacterized protein LOC141838269 [Curcuma longa]|uniref:uncharacterized protein LOC141838269 n=1 Tax=Curcuma longa TaxID=136217 RepID=UPI003D9E68F3
MAAMELIEKYRDGAEVYSGDAICKEKTIEAMLELCLPTGLLPLEDMVEVGYNREHSFMWLTQRKKKEHMFKKIKQMVSYATEVTAFVEERKLKKITGVKARELLIWLSVVEVFIGDPLSGKITFKTGTGLSDTFPVSAFELEQ